MIDQVRAWHRLAMDLGIEVVAPCEINLANGSRFRATAHVRNFGAENGMVVEPNYAALKPYADALTAAGYGYSAMELNDLWDRAAVIEMLADWGWTSPRPRPPWLPNSDN
ncbi:MAG TPA: hypothetical protein VJR58_31120 [Vineibacter sp.]|nr:hypothetical protein [Vineibacter sp.]